MTTVSVPPAFVVEFKVLCTAVNAQDDLDKIKMLIDAVEDAADDFGVVIKEVRWAQ